MDPDNIPNRELKRARVSSGHSDDHDFGNEGVKRARTNDNCSTNEKQSDRTDLPSANTIFPGLHGYLGSSDHPEAQLRTQRCETGSEDRQNAIQLQIAPGNMFDQTVPASDHTGYLPATLQNGPCMVLEPQHNKTNSRGHTYGNIDVSDSANVQNGDSHRYYGPGAQMQDFSYVAGNMTVNHSHHVIQQPRVPNPVESDLELKKALYYDSMDARRAQLEVVDPASLEWVWQRTSFPQWLQSDDKLYWISGKPASGKSTLLNHLIGRGRERVMATLRKKDPNSVIVHFFFDFRAGSGVANSLVGLLRSLLLQLIHASDHVNKYCLRHYGYRLPGTWPNDVNQLSTLLIDALKDEERLICGMVDGLDEYQGNLQELLKVLRKISISPRIKLCLASRPSSRFAQHFGSASFEMQEHNSETISANIDAAFSSLPPSHIHVCGHCLARLKQTIQHDANGIVLWVKFAVSEMLDTLHNAEEVDDAIEQLQELPTELADIYARILGRLDPGQQIEAAVVLFILRAYPANVYVDEVMVYYSIVMNTVFQKSTQFLAEKDVRRFRLRVRNVIEGLVDFVTLDGKNENENEDKLSIRLTHETLNTFLEHDEATLEHIRRIERVFPRGCFPYQISARMITMLSNTISSQEILADHEMKSQLHSEDVVRRMAQQSGPSLGIHCSFKTIFWALEVDKAVPAFHLYECKQCMRYELQIRQSWLARHVSFRALWQESGVLPELSEEAVVLCNDYPELLHIMNSGLRIVLEALFEQDLGHVPDKIKDELRRGTW